MYQNSKTNQLTTLIARYRNNPVLFVREVIGAKPEPEQIEMLHSVQENKMTAVKAGHGVGKTTALAWLILWFMTTRLNPKIPCTAPTMQQLKNILWAEISKWLAQSPMLKILFEWTAERLSLRGNGENWFAVARTATLPDAMQGFHGESLLFVIDEASGIKDNIFEPILGSLTGEDTKFVMAGNPTRNTGFFHDAFTRNRKRFNCLTLNAENSKRVNRDYIQTIIDLYGKDSDPYRVRVSGEFPLSESDTYIPLDVIERAISVNNIGNVIDLHIGVDVARYGDDESTIYVVEQYPNSYREQKHIILTKLATTELTGAIKQEIQALNRTYPEITVNVNVDGGGVGAGVVDMLEDNHGDLNYVVHEKTFGGDGGTLVNEPMLYSNDTGLMWGNAKRLLLDGKLSLQEDSELFAQLTNRKYKIDEDGKICLERKADMKKRGIHSPDRADGLVLALSTNINVNGGIAILREI